jgi:hypothetical protein
MSKLYYSEQGHIISALCEELTYFRRIRKVMSLPRTDNLGQLFFLAYAYPDSHTPLHLSINGILIPPVDPKPSEFYLWYSVPLQPEWLRVGDNIFEFWAESTAMNSWSIGYESGHPRPASFASDDGGQTWRNEKMGFLNASLGEYVVRVRLAEGEDPYPPTVAWEDFYHPRLVSLRRLLPSEVLLGGKLYHRVRALTTWLSTSWAHESKAFLYAPWDAETILAWGKVRKGHDQLPPITMCVHYGVTFVSACMAAHIPARCLVGTTELNDPGGHFVAEVWFDEHHKWGVVDPNLDVIYLKNNSPCSVDELRSAGPQAGKLAVFGPGNEYQRRFPHMEAFMESEIFQDASWADHRSLWPRTDFLSHPELTPPGHGVNAYSETGLVWETKDLEQGFAMFPYFADQNYYNAPPSGWD